MKQVIDFFIANPIITLILNILGLIGLIVFIHNIFRKITTYLWMKKRFCIYIELWNGQIRNVVTNQLSNNIGNQITCATTLDQKRSEVAKFKINGMEDDGPRVDLQNTIYNEDSKEQARKLFAKKVVEPIEKIEVWIRNINNQNILHWKVNKKKISENSEVYEFLRSPKYSDGGKKVLIINSKEIKLDSK